MMLSKKYILALLLSAALISCDDYLDNKPKGYSIPTYMDDYALLLNGMLLGYYGENYPAYITDDAVLAETGVPTNVMFNQKTEYEQALYTFEHGNIFPTSMHDSYWEDSYEKIYVYNVVANNILNVPDGTEAKKKELYAEAITQRAFIYFALVNSYAPQYTPQTADNYGVPLVLSEDISKTYVRNTIGEVYDKMVEDLESSVEFLPDVANNKFHPDKATGYTLLAKVYLFMGKYSEALKAANMAYNCNKTSDLVDYKLYHALDGESSGRIVDDNEEQFPRSSINPESMFIKLPPNDLASDFLVSEELINLFEKDLPAGAVDKRREMFYAKDEANTYQKFEFPGYYMYIAHIMPNYGINYQELLLILAECEARNGSVENSLRYLNQLRDKRIVNNTPLVASDSKEALKLSLEERRREMACWGCSRYFDLKRLNAEPEFAKTVVHKLGNTEYVLGPNDLRYVLPVPHNVVEFNPDIPQYDR